jgi:dTDP-4-dehydrorhamnose 3,5-epimerase-like enzyme
MQYQAAPYEEIELVQCTMNVIYDVVSDLRPDPTTFQQWVPLELTVENRCILYIPEKSAYGFQTLEIIPRSFTRCLSSTLIMPEE